MSKPEQDRQAHESTGYRGRVYEMVRRIPPGRVMTYGQIAEILGEGYTPRTVGFVMHGAEEERTPWQRVINSQGRCSTSGVVLPADRQQRILEIEGVVFDASGRCDLGRYQWTPEEYEQADREKDQGRPTLFTD